MNKEIINCALYTRVSTHQQVENDYNSLETQKEKLQDYCKFHGYEVYDVYEDGGFSGGTLERPALKRMMNDISRKEINCVVVYKLDRLVRSMKDFFGISDFFEKNNVKFVSISQNFDTNSSSGRLSLNVLMTKIRFKLS